MHSFECPACRRVSHNAGDIQHRYCSHCRRFFDQYESWEAAREAVVAEEVAEEIAREGCGT